MTMHAYTHTSHPLSDRLMCLCIYLDSKVLQIVSQQIRGCCNGSLPLMIVYRAQPWFNVLHRMKTGMRLSSEDLRITLTYEDNISRCDCNTYFKPTQQKKKADLSFTWLTGYHKWVFFYPLLFVIVFSKHWEADIYSSMIQPIRLKTETDHKDAYTNKILLFW